MVLLAERAAGVLGETDDPNADPDEHSDGRRETVADAHTDVHAAAGSHLGRAAARPLRRRQRKPERLDQAHELERIPGSLPRQRTLAWTTSGSLGNVYYSVAARAASPASARSCPTYRAGRLREGRLSCATISKGLSYSDAKDRTFSDPLTIASLTITGSGKYFFDSSVYVTGNVVIKNTLAKVSFKKLYVGGSLTVSSGSLTGLTSAYVAGDTSLTGSGTWSMGGATQTTGLLVTGGNLTLGGTQTMGTADAPVKIIVSGSTARTAKEGCTGTYYGLLYNGSGGVSMQSGTGQGRRVRPVRRNRLDERQLLGQLRPGRRQRHLRRHGAGDDGALANGSPLPADAWYKTSPVTISLSAAAGGWAPVTGFGYSINGIPGVAAVTSRARSPYPQPRFRCLPTGAYTVKFWSLDSVGNTGPVQKRRRPHRHRTAHGGLHRQARQMDQGRQRPLRLDGGRQPRRRRRPALRDEARQRRLRRLRARPPAPTSAASPRARTPSRSRRSTSPATRARSRAGASLSTSPRPRWASPTSPPAGSRSTAPTSPGKGPTTSPRPPTCATRPSSTTPPSAPGARPPAPTSAASPRARTPSRSRRSTSPATRARSRAGASLSTSPRPRWASPTSPPAGSRSTAPTSPGGGADNLASAADLRYATKLDNAAFGAWGTAASADLSGLAEGALTFQVKAIDLAGNESQVASWSFSSTSPTPRSPSPGTRLPTGRTER